MEVGAYNVTLTVRDAKGNYNRSAMMVTVQEGGTACAAAPAAFTASVWPSMSNTCTLCHFSGRVAGGSGLVFTGGSTIDNYNVLRNYTLKNESTLLSKVVGGMGGSAPLMKSRYVSVDASWWVHCAVVGVVGVEPRQIVPAELTAPDNGAALAAVTPAAARPVTRNLNSKPFKFFMCPRGSSRMRLAPISASTAS